MQLELNWSDVSQLFATSRLWDMKTIQGPLKIVRLLRRGIRSTYVHVCTAYF
jgi:hypothetical protein